MRLDGGSAGIERAVDDELQFHFEMTMRDLMANGMSPDDARREAERRFGDVQRHREQLATIDRARAGRERRAEWWSGFAQDVRYAVRGLRLSPGFTVAVVLTLGLGLGANAMMFGIVDRLLFRPPAYLATPDRVNKLYFARTNRGDELISSYTGYRSYLDVRENTTAFDAMTPFYVEKLAVGDGDATREMNVAMGGADLWKMFDAKPVIGRFFTAAEDTPPDGARVAVLSYAFWQTQFGGRADVLGRSIDIGPARYTIIGVAPEGFNAFSSLPVVAFLSGVAQTAASGVHGMRPPWYANYGFNYFEIFARRKPPVGAAAATADLSRAWQIAYRNRIAQQHGMTAFAIAKPRAFVGPVLEDRGPKARREAKVATWLVGVAVIVLIIAAANVANLLLARALRRRREIAVRIALGISRSRLLMQLVTESVILALAGGFLGLAFAQWGGAAVRRLLLDESGESAAALTDSRTIVVVAALAVVAGLLSGLAPVFQTTRADVAAALKAGSREGTMQRSRLRAALLVAQAALSVVLLVGAGLFVRSLFNVEHVRLGFDSDQLLWVQPNSRGVKMDSVQQVQLRNDLAAAARRVPGVENATRALTVPFWQTWDFELYIDGIDSVAKLGDFTLQAATPEFFRTMGTRLLRGRGITAQDRADAPKVMVVSGLMAKKLWPNQDPIGKCVRMSPVVTSNGVSTPAPCWTVVGVAEDVRRESVSEPEPHYYLSTEQFHPADGGVFVRTHGDATDHADEVRRALQKVMPGASYVAVTPMTTVIAPYIRSWKIGATMFAVFGVLALVLASVGLYSVIAYNVTQRTHEMGVRVALGAQARDVVALIIRGGLRVVAPGVVLGAIIALVASRWVAPLLFNVSPKDPPVIVAVMVTLLAVAVAASWLPAMRASRVDPNAALRSD